MQILDLIEDQVAATKLPLVAITMAAVPCPNTPVILTLHWHGFIRESLAPVPEASTIRFSPIPSSALQVNEVWSDLVDLDRAALEAGWALGAWDVARAERASCARPGAEPSETVECLQAFGMFPFGLAGNQVVVSEAPDCDELVEVAGRRGYLMWLFRPVHGGIWQEVSEDETLAPDGTRELPCPVAPVPPSLRDTRKTVYRFGRTSDLLS